jgi:imidazolonepropionase-like amidohydrolase
MPRSLVGFFTVIWLLGVPAWAQVTIIRNARVVDGTGSPARLASVVIRDSRIEAITPNDAAVSAGARLLDAQGKTLLPGLFDLHTHLSSSAATGLNADWGKDLKAYLAAGVTTVNDYSAYGEMFAPMRQLLASGEMPGPRVQLAYRLSTPGGHGTESGWGDFFTLTASTAAEAHAQMKKILPYKPDIIKIFTDGWRYGSIPDLSSMNQETIAAIVQDAHAAGIRVFTHTVTLRGAKIAVRAGIDALAHGIGDAAVDQEFIDLMKSKGTAYISTLAVFESKRAGSLPPRAIPLLEPAILDRLNGRAPAEPSTASSAPGPRAARWKFLLANVRQLHEAGIPVACGTDAGMAGTYHGYSTLHELELLVEAGLSPMDALVAATSTSARAAGLDGDRGTIAPGKLADLLLVDGQPDQKIADIEKTAAVFLGGKQLDLAALKSSIASRELTPLPVSSVPARIDDMENADRTSLGTLRVDATDEGADHSRLLFEPIIREGAREGADHSLMLEAALAAKQHPYVRLELPLTPGGFDLADISRYHGISFMARGRCACRVVMNTYNIRNGDFFAAPFDTSGAWANVKIPFSSLHAKSAAEKWDPRSMRIVTFEVAGPAESKAWLELDQVEFY